MLKAKSQRAFSLIELSLVILVLVILVIGLTQTRNIINRFQLQTARSLTNSSPVISINGLELWLETTSSESFFGNYPENKDRISLWQDLNLQSGIKNNATQSNSSLRPYFYENVINGLPGIYFTPDSTQILNGTYPVNPKNSAIGSFSFFLVAVSNQTGNFQAAFDTGTWNLKGWSFSRLQSGYNNKLRFVVCYSGNCPAFNMNMVAPNDVVQIYSITIDNNKKLWYRINGDNQIYTQTSMPAMSAVTTGYIIGNDQSWINALGSGAWRGYIGEIIFYNRPLNDNDRKSIEKYLGQKWKVSVL